MTDDHNQSGPADEDDEDADGLCDDETCLEDHELTGDHELPAATGGVAE